MIPEQVALAAIFFFEQSFCFVKVNRQKPVGMGSTNICIEHIQTFLTETIPHCVSN